jgi:transposase InsO family protein
MLASMSGKSDCHDNAVAESFFATLEFELLMTHDWHTGEEARRAIFRYIEPWDNRKRRHSTLGYVSLAESDAQLLKAMSFLSYTRQLFRGNSIRKRSPGR